MLMILLKYRLNYLSFSGKDFLTALLGPLSPANKYNQLREGNFDVLFPFYVIINNLLQGVT